MARAKSKTKSKGKSTARNKGEPDAIALLKADHRQVEEWFEQFEKAKDKGRQQALATKICDALKVHATIEEEIFYPPFLEATKDEDMYYEAEVEHDGAKKLIADIEHSTPEDPDFKSKLHVLSEMIKHHVKEEEQAGGMFAEAREAEMDLIGLGRELAQRKAELEAKEPDDSDDMPPPKGDQNRGILGRLMRGTR